MQKTMTGENKVEPAWQTPARDGTGIVSTSKLAKVAQAGSLEALALKDPRDGPMGDKAGECMLQDYTYGYGDGNKNIVYRLRPRVNPQAQGHFMCDEGRLGYHYANSAKRFSRPQTRRDGKLTPLSWQEATAAIRKGFKDAAAQDAGSVVGVLS